MRNWTALLSTCCILALPACRGSEDAAVEVVRTYNARLAEAYRTADVDPIRGVAGEEEVRKVAGLIGVKLDQGISLDAQLLDFKVVVVRAQGEDVEVRTSERWYYADRQIGTGVQVGADSTDHYEMVYTVRKESGRRVVALVEFFTEPVVGRSESNHAPARLVHGIETRSPEQERVELPRQPSRKSGAEEAR